MCKSQHSKVNRSVTPRLKAGACVWTPPQLTVPGEAQCFGFTVRRIRGRVPWAYRQDARAHPVLPEEQRSHRNVSRADQVGMEAIMAVLALKQEALLGAVPLRGIAAFRARLARVVRVHFHRHAPRKQRFVGEEAVQFSKRPRGGVPVGPSLLPRRLFPSLAAGAVADMGQVFQADQAVRMASHNAAADLVVGCLLQPSLPPGDHEESSCRRTGAFSLQPFPQPRIMVCFGPHFFSGKEGGAVIEPRYYCQVALPHVHPDDSLVRLRRRLRHLSLEGDQQIEALLGFVIPEFSRADLGPTLDQRHMLVIARVRHDDAPAKRQDADLLALLQAVVAMEVVGERWGDVVGSPVQPFVALLSQSRLALLRILSGLCPQARVGGPYL